MCQKVKILDDNKRIQIFERKINNGTSKHIVLKNKFVNINKQNLISLALQLPSYKQEYKVSR